jgi:hypothetical protein
MRRVVAFVGAVLMLGGCGSVYGLVQPQRTTIANVYSVEPQIAWSSAQSGKFQAWTVDGFDLQRVRFVNGLEEGEALSRSPDKAQRPMFRKGMTGVEIAELVVDDLRVGGAKAEAKNIRPQRFGTADGFRFDLKLVTVRGLERNGVVVGTVIKDKLYLIEYSGTGNYHFGRYKAEVERLIDSIRMP